MAKTVPCFNSYKLQLALFLGGGGGGGWGDFGLSADALIVLLLFVQILYDTNSAIIQLPSLISKDQKENIICTVDGNL